MNLIVAICMLFFIYQVLSFNCPQYDQLGTSNSTCNSSDSNDTQDEEEEEGVRAAEDVNNHLSYPQCRQTYISSKMVVSPFKEVENKVPPKSYSSVCIKCAACLAVAEKFEAAFQKVSALRKEKKRIEDSVDHDDEEIVSHEYFDEDDSLPRRKVSSLRKEKKRIEDDVDHDEEETASDEYFGEDDSLPRRTCLERMKNRSGHRNLARKARKRRCPAFDENHENDQLTNLSDQAESKDSWYSQYLYPEDKPDRHDVTNEANATMPYSYPEIEATLKEDLSNVCSRSFRNYDLRQNAGVQFLTNNFFNTTHVPSTMDGKWCGKLRAICVMFMNHADLQYLYYKSLNASTAVDMKEYLCQNVGIFKDCVNVELEKCYIGKHEVFGDHFISCDNPECKTCEDRSCLML